MYGEEHDQRDVLIQHGIGIHQAYQGKGYSAYLLRYAMNKYARNKVAEGMIDLARKRDDTFVEIFNDRSFALHLNHADFFLTGIVDPPVYDKELFCGRVVRDERQSFSSSFFVLDIGALRENPENMLHEMRRAISDGYVGVHYDRTTQRLLFRSR